MQTNRQITRKVLTFAMLSCFVMCSGCIAIRPQGGDTFTISITSEPAPKEIVVLVTQSLDRSSIFQRYIPLKCSDRQINLVSKSHFNVTTNRATNWLFPWTGLLGQVYMLHEDTVYLIAPGYRPNSAGLARYSHDFLRKEKGEGWDKVSISLKRNNIDRKKTPWELYFEADDYRYLPSMLESCDGLENAPVAVKRILIQALREADEMLEQYEKLVPPKGYEYSWLRTKFDRSRALVEKQLR